LHLKGYATALNDETVSGLLGLGSDETLPSLPTVRARTTWLLAKATAQTPAMVRPLIRSLLLPKLEQLDSESLETALLFLQETVLPWLVGSSDGADVGPDYELA
jgi:hypothetical protein